MKIVFLIIFFSSTISLFSQGIDKDAQKELEKYDAPKDSVFVVVEQMPSFPGGESELYKYIGNNLKYPIIPKEEGIQTRGMVRFVVSREGKIKNITIMRDNSISKALAKAIEGMPDWIPGKQGGKPVDVYYTIPLNIHLKNQLIEAHYYSHSLFL